MKVAFSPCPNDTFVFYAWVHGLVPGAPQLDVSYADVDVTNELAVKTNDYDLLKVSCAVLPLVLTKYALLPCGGALGNGCGPLVLVRKDEDKKDPALLSGKRIAVPSERSTAYLLFRLWAASHIPGGIGKIEVMPFHQIMPAVQNGRIDAGLVIHEARFTYPSYGLYRLVDLGEWWTQETGLPIPLGAIVARKDLDTAKISDWIRRSVEYAWEHPGVYDDYVMQHAQELERSVIQQHIELYVNEFTRDLGETGYKAISVLLERSADEGLLPSVQKEQLFPS